MLLLIASTAWLTSCQAVSGGDEVCPEEEPVEVKHYINFTVKVSNGHTATRAGERPQPGENGDGRETGFERENAVSGITVILYQDADGINTGSNPVIDFAAYYPTTLVNREDQGTSATVEAQYTTGDRLVSAATFDGTKKYHAIVVANKNLTSNITVGTTTLGGVRDMVMREDLYTGTTVGDATDFIMSSEKDYVIVDAKIDKASDPHKIVYRFDDIMIERLAARIDFWAVNSKGYNDNDEYETPGYVYSVADAPNDYFVITGITPFNLNSYDASNGGTYLIKRLTDEMSEGYTVSYLANEDGTNYVVDPATEHKGDGNLTYFKNQLSTLNPAEATTHSGNGLYRSAADLHASLSSRGGTANFSDASVISGTGDNLIVTYAQENTLWEASLLYNYATGLAIEGDYYQNGTLKEHKVYYGYLRHNGSLSGAYTTMQGQDLVNTDKSTSGTAMEYSIVRNNIYRVYISKIKKMESGDVELTLNIKVKMWDKFTHETIYM